MPVFRSRWWLALVLAAVLPALGLALRSPATSGGTGAQAQAQPTPTATPAPMMQLPPAIGTTRFGTLRDPAFEALPGAQARFGAYEGGVYRIETPDNWNGVLVMYAHGYRGEGPDIFVTNSPIRAHLIQDGFAWAASSYRGNGYRPDWGVDDTLSLRDLFIREVGEPRMTIIEGTSMGGHVTVASLEQHAGVYQGALAECGVMTGTEVLDYLAAYSAAAEYISGLRFSAAATGEEFTRLVMNDWLQVMGVPGNYTEKGRQFDSVVKYLMGGDLPMRTQGLAARYTQNVSRPSTPANATTPPGRAASTTYIRYRVDPGLGLDEDELNREVRRVSPAPGARSATENPVFADFTGRITVPVLSVHTTGDAFVPFSLEQSYRRKTLAVGTSDLLVQRGIRRPNHCQFMVDELSQAFDDLMAWITDGTKPEGDDVLAADLSTLGLRWTKPLLPDDPMNK